MRRTILLGLFALLAVSAANDACAQRGGGARPGFARGGFARGGHGFNRARAVSPYGFGYASLPYDDSGAAYDYAPQPVVLVQQPPVFVQPPEPPVVEPPVHPVVKEYKWPAARRGFFPLRVLDNLRVRATGLCDCPQERFDPLRRNGLRR